MKIIHPEDDLVRITIQRLKVDKSGKPYYEVEHKMVSKAVAEALTAPQLNKGTDRKE